MRAGAPWNLRVDAGAHECRRQLAQPRPLASLRVEVLRCEPALVRRLQGRPLLVDDGKPGGVAIAASDDHRTAKMAFVSESEPQCGPARRGVERIALPFVAAVAEGLQRVRGEQVHRLGGHAGTRDARSPVDVADLDAPVDGRDAQERLPALGPAGGAVDHGEEQGIRRCCGTGQPGGEEPGRVGRQLGHVAKARGSVGRRGGLAQVVAMAIRVERLEPRMASLQHAALGGLRGPGIGKPRADRKPRIRVDLPGDLVVVNASGHGLLRTCRRRTIAAPDVFVEQCSMRGGGARRRLRFRRTMGRTPVLQLRLDGPRETERLDARHTHGEAPARPGRSHYSRARIGRHISSRRNGAPDTLAPRPGTPACGERGDQ